MHGNDLLGAIEERYGFGIPDVYRSLSAAGHFDHRGNACLDLTDVEWLTPQDIAAYEFLDWQAPHKTWFVPFAISARRDEWGWRLDWSAGGEPPVVFCERGPEGRGYAPDFRGFLYRMLLEELSGSWLLTDVDDEKGQQRVARSVEIVLPHLPQPWAARLKRLVQESWHSRDGFICVYPRSECDQIVAKELAFGHLNEKFWQEEPLKPKKPAGNPKSDSAKTNNPGTTEP